MIFRIGSSGSSIHQVWNHTPSSCRITRLQVLHLMPGFPSLIEHRFGVQTVDTAMNEIRPTPPPLRHGPTRRVGPGAPAPRPDGRPEHEHERVSANHPGPSLVAPPLHLRSPLTLGASKPGEWEPIGHSNPVRLGDTLDDNSSTDSRGRWSTGELAQLVEQIGIEPIQGNCSILRHDWLLTCDGWESATGCQSDDFARQGRRAARLHFPALKGLRPIVGHGCYVSRGDTRLSHPGMT